MTRNSCAGAVLVLSAIAACGDNHAAPQQVDAKPFVPADAAIDGPPPDAPPPMVRVFGHVEAYGQAQDGMQVVTLEGSSQSMLTDAQGDFYFDAPEGSRLIVEVQSGTRPLLSMIRGVIAQDHLRPRVFYLVTDDEIAATEAATGVTFDASTAIVEVDFRNAEIGGYGATLTSSASTVLTPTFGVALDSGGTPQNSQVTLAGGDGSTLLLGGLPAGSATFAPIVPVAATLPCQPRDANPLPLVAGKVTWFDYECGNGMD
jgi:hypothetical protein